ncbi:MAG: FISUMP domain-containing protein [Bacteroidia bacterium]
MKNLYLIMMAVVALTWGVELNAQGVNGANSNGNVSCIPAVSTTSSGSIATDSVVIGGDIMHDGGSAIVLRGVCYSLSPNPDMSDFRTQDGSGIGVFSTVLRGLTPGTTYYARSYAKNAGGLVAYGNEVTFTTLAALATVTTTAATAVTSNSAATGGNVTSDGGAAVTARGVAYGTSANPTVSGTSTSDGSGTGVFTSQLTGLTSTTLYHVRAYATNAAGTAYGNEVTFTTLAALATVTTTAATAVTSNSAATGGNVTSDGGAAVTARGVAYGTSANPTVSGTSTSDGSGTGVFTSQLTGLTSTTLYHVRAYATNAAGTAYGNEVTFTTVSAGPQPCPGAPTVTDVDGNSYATVQIGTQCWTQSNLTVSKYRNGDNITNITDNTQWSQTNTSSTGAWCNYNNDASNGTTYGKLYNWYAVNDSRGLCPTGWHVPSDAEWTTLENHLGGSGSTVAAGAMKSTTGWFSNIGATNSSGFTGLPGGQRFYLGFFISLGENGAWWSSSDAGPGAAWYRNLNHSFLVGVTRGNYDHRNGWSVRCVRD